MYMRKAKCKLFSFLFQPLLYPGGFIFMEYQKVRYFLLNLCKCSLYLKTWLSHHSTQTSLMTNFFKLNFTWYITDTCAGLFEQEAFISFITEPFHVYFTLDQYHRPQRPMYDHKSIIMINIWYINHVFLSDYEKQIQKITATETHSFI